MDRKGSQMGWTATEGFGADYAVPDVIVNLEGIINDSWHNDACPSFRAPDLGEDEVTLKIWCDHPDEDKREMFGPRFSVTLLSYTSETDWVIADVAAMLDVKVDDRDTLCFSSDDSGEIVKAFMVRMLATRIVIKKQAISDAQQVQDILADL